MNARQQQTQGKGKKGKEKIQEKDVSNAEKPEPKAYFTWNLEMERVMADVLRDQRMLGNKSDGSWKAVAYNAVASVLSSQFKVHFHGENVKNHFRLWRKYYGIVFDILSHSGFNWDGTKSMITVDNENAWNEYIKSHKEAQSFRYKVIPNWDDIVDLCAKDRATGCGAETALDADDIISKEASIEKTIGETDESIADWTSTTQGLEESERIQKKRGQSDSSFVMKSQRRKVGERDSIASSFKEVAASFKEFLEASKKPKVNIKDVLLELDKAPNLNRSEKFKAIKWLTNDVDQYHVLKELPDDLKEGYILSCLS